MLLDIIFPKTCVNCKKLGDFICTDCFSRLSFREGKLKGDGKLDGYFIAISSNGASRKIIRAFKKQHLASLKGLIGDLMYDSLIQNEEFVKELPRSLLVPMPIGKLSFRKRGFNESSVIANELSKRLKIQIKDPLEYKKGKIQNKGKSLDNETILLVEDVPNKIRLEEASKILKQNGAFKVFSLSFIK